MSNLKILPVAYTSEERIQAQINSFRKMFITQNQDFDITYCNELIDIIIDYLATYDDSNPALTQAYTKLQETSFWLDSSFNY